MKSQWQLIHWEVQLRLLFSWFIHTKCLLVSSHALVPSEHALFASPAFALSSSLLSPNQHAHNHEAIFTINLAQLGFDTLASACFLTPMALDFIHAVIMPCLVPFCGLATSSSATPKGTVVSHLALCQQ
jgi:hypothetical protein